MRKFIGAIFLAGLLCCVPQKALAMGADFDVRFGHEEDRWVSEIWYERTLLCQISFSPSGAMPVSTQAARYQTVITPDFEEGFFLLRIK